uniref:Uncharacterized protein n=1 Tax=Anguilla anguilla TaxID=7936 RepID=A0A0E9PXQ1_ANGAN
MIDSSISCHSKEPVPRQTKVSHLMHFNLELRVKVQDQT